MHGLMDCLIKGLMDRLIDGCSARTAQTGAYQLFKRLQKALEAVMGDVIPCSYSNAFWTCLLGIVLGSVSKVYQLHIHYGIDLDNLLRFFRT